MRKRKKEREDEMKEEKDPTYKNKKDIIFLNIIHR